MSDSPGLVIELGGRRAAVAHLLSAFTPVSQSTLQRIEQMPEPPPDANRRILTVLALVLYAIDPTDFGLSLEELPERMRPDKPLGMKAWRQITADPSARRGRRELRGLGDLLDPPDGDIGDSGSPPFTRCTSSCAAA